MARHGIPPPPSSLLAPQEWRQSGSWKIGHLFCSRSGVFCHSSPRTQGACFLLFSKHATVPIPGGIVKGEVDQAMTPQRSEILVSGYCHEHGSGADLRSLEFPRAYWQLYAVLGCPTFVNGRVRWSASLGKARRQRLLGRAKRKR